MFKSRVILLHFHWEERQRHVVRQLAAFTNVWRWHVAQADRVNLEKTALDICHDMFNHIIITTH